MATTKFIESGSAATNGLEWWSTDTGNGGAVSSDSQAILGSVRSVKLAVGGTAGAWAGVFSPNTVLADAGRRISMGFRYTGTLNSTGAGADILSVVKDNSSSVLFSLGLTNAGHPVLFSGNGTTVYATGTSTLATSTDYRLQIVYTVTSTTVNTITAKVYDSSNTLLDTLSVTNVTLQGTGSNVLMFEQNAVHNPGANVVFYGAHFFVDDGTSGDIGNARVTAKRPNANGTTNGYTTQIGSGGSGYGTGHSPQVNERPLSTTNGWSMIGAGSAITEEYNIENQSTGDVDITGATILDYEGWLYSKALVSETAKIIVNGVSTNISLTTSNALFTQIAGSATYPAGTGADIGEITSTTVTTVSLYEAGIIVAYIPATTDTISVFDSSAVTENITVEIVNLVNVFDSSAATESVTMLEIDNVSVSDSLAVTESVSPGMLILLPPNQLGWIEFSPVTESTTTSIFYPAVVFDSSTVTENITINVPVTLSVFDSSAVTENVTMEIIYFVNVFDSSAVTENVTLLITDFVNVLDSSTVTESITMEIIYFVNISDSSTVTDIVTQILITNFISVFDTSIVTENVTVVIPMIPEIVFDSSIVTENITVSVLGASGIVLFDSSTVTENTVVEIVNIISIFDSSTVTDNVSMDIPVNLSVFDPSTVTDVPTVVIIDLVSVSDSSAVTDVLSQVLQIYNVSIFDSSTVTESISITSIEFEVIFDTSTVTDVVSQILQIYIVNVSDTSTVTENILMESIQDEIIFDSSAVTDIPTVVIPMIPEIVNDSSVVTDGLIVEIIDTEIISDSSAVTESITVTIVYLPNVSDSSTTTDVIVQMLQTYNISVFDASTITDVAIPEPFLFNNAPLYYGLDTGEISIMLGDNKAPLWNGTVNRPTNPPLGAFGFNYNDGQWEIWDGKKWWVRTFV